MFPGGRGCNHGGGWGGDALFVKVAMAGVALGSMKQCQCWNWTTEGVRKTTDVSIEPCIDAVWLRTIHEIIIQFEPCTLLALGPCVTHLFFSTRSELVKQIVMAPRARWGLLDSRSAGVLRAIPDSVSQATVQRGVKHGGCPHVRTRAVCACRASYKNSF